MDLALNNLQRLICHKTQTNKQTNHENAFAHYAQLIQKGMVKHKVV